MNPLTEEDVKNNRDEYNKTISLMEKRIIILRLVIVVAVLTLGLLIIRYSKTPF